MSGNIAFAIMVLIYTGITFGVAVLAWSKGYNTGRAEAVVKIERRLRAVK